SQQTCRGARAAPKRSELLDSSHAVAVWTAWPIVPKSDVGASVCRHQDQGGERSTWASDVHRGPSVSDMALDPSHRPWRLAHHERWTRDLVRCGGAHLSACGSNRLANGVLDGGLSHSRQTASVQHSVYRFLRAHDWRAAARVAQRNRRLSESSVLAR